MALKPVNQGNQNSGPIAYKKASEMKDGEVVRGFVSGIQSKPSTMNDGLMTTIYLKQEDGSSIGLSVSGTLKYDIQDNRIKQGLYTEITANGKVKKKNKAGVAYSQGSFTVLQDDERTLEDASFAALSEDVAPQTKKGAAGISQAAALRTAANKS